jgi:hypothetical protein
MPIRHEHCCPHDFVDWLAALATVFAGAATIAVYKRSEAFHFRHQLEYAHDLN